MDNTLADLIDEYRQIADSQVLPGGSRYTVFTDGSWILCDNDMDPMLIRKMQQHDARIRSERFRIKRARKAKRKARREAKARRKFGAHSRED